MYYCRTCEIYFDHCLGAYGCPGCCGERAACHVSLYDVGTLVDGMQPRDKGESDVSRDTTPSGS